MSVKINIKKKFEIIRWVVDGLGILKWSWLNFMGILVVLLIKIKLKFLVCNCILNGMCLLFLSFLLDCFQVIVVLLELWVDYYVGSGDE